MSGEATVSEPLRTLADKVNWLIDRAHPQGRGPYSNAELAEMITKASGVEVSYTTVWKLRNGKAQNPQKKLIEALARTFHVPPAFFFDDYGEDQAGLLQEQVELLALIRDAGIDRAQLRAILGLSPEARKAITDLIEVTARDDARRRRAETTRPAEPPAAQVRDQDDGSSVTPARKHRKRLRWGRRSTESAEVSRARYGEERAARRRSPGS